MVKSVRGQEAPWWFSAIGFLLPSSLWEGNSVCDPIEKRERISLHTQWLFEICTWHQVICADALCLCGNSGGAPSCIAGLRQLMTAFVTIHKGVSLVWRRATENQPQAVLTLSSTFPWRQCTSLIGQLPLSLAWLGLPSCLSTKNSPFDQGKCCRDSWPPVAQKGWGCAVCPSHRL